MLGNVKPGWNEASIRWKLAANRSPEGEGSATESSNEDVVMGRVSEQHNKKNEGGGIRGSGGILFLDSTRIV